MGPLGLSGCRLAQHDYLPSGRAWASLGARGPARHNPLANPGRTDTVPVGEGILRPGGGMHPP
jgi:hypothetical protein